MNNLFVSFPASQNHVSSIFSREKKILEALRVDSQVIRYYKKKMETTLEGLSLKKKEISTHCVQLKEELAHVFAIAHDRPRALSPILVSSDNTRSLIDHEIDQMLDAVKDKMDRLREIHRETGLQEEDAAYASQLPLELAKLIVLPEGKLNLAFISKIKDRFLSDTTLDAEGNEDPVDWQVQTKKILDELQNKPQFVEMIESARIPEEGNEQSDILIRVTLGMLPEEKITPYHARLVLLAALLSSVRQGPVGNCFVICNMIWYYSAVLGRVIADLSELIEKGWISRNTNRFSYILNIADDALQTPFRVTNAIWKAPGIQAVCLQLNTPVGSKVEVSDKMTPESLIDKLCELSTRNLDKGRLKRLGYIAFNAQVATPLLNAYASCLAGMDQSKRSDYLHRKIDRGWRRTFKPFWREIKAEDKDLEMIRKVKFSFEEQLGNRLLIEYDESVRTPLSADGNSTAGGFVYFENLGQNPNEAVPLKEPHDIQRYSINSWIFSVDECKKIQNFAVEKFLQLPGFVTSPTFLPNFFENYDTAIGKLSSLELQWAKFLSFGEIGGDNVDVFLHAMGIPLPDPDQLKGSAEERLISLVTLLRKLQEKWHFLDNQEEDERLMMDSDTHAFTLAMENKYLTPWIKAKESVEELIDTRIRQPAMGISQAQINEEQKKYFLRKCLYMVPREFEDKLQEEVKNLECDTVQSYSQALLKLILKFNPDISEDEKSAKIASFTNRVFSKLLTEEQLKTLETLTVPAPDTNWKDDDRRSGQILAIYFGFNLNPVTGNIELFRVNENKKELHALSQKDWVDGPWNIYALDLKNAIKRVSTKL